MMCERIVLVGGEDESCIFPRIMSSVHGSESKIRKHPFTRDSPVFTYDAHAIQFSPVGGQTGFVRAVSLLLKSAEQKNIRMRSLGLVCDSDDDPVKSLNNLQNALKKAGLPVPKSHASFTGQDPTVVIFVLPDGESHGSLDTLCRKSVDDDPRSGCVDGYLNCLKNFDTSVKYDDKSFVFAYSIAVGRKGERAGSLARHGGLCLNHDVFNPLEKFLEKLLFC